MQPDVRKHIFRSARNTLWCLLGCAIGDLGAIALFERVYAPDGPPSRAMDDGVDNRDGIGHTDERVAGDLRTLETAWTTRSISYRCGHEHGVHAFDGGVHERCRLRHDGEVGDQSCHSARYALGGLPGGLAL